MKYLKQFEDNEALNLYLNGDDVIFPNVSIINDSDTVIYKSMPEIDKFYLRCTLVIPNGNISDNKFTFEWYPDKTWNDYVGCLDIDKTVKIGTLNLPSGLTTITLESIDKKDGPLGSTLWILEVDINSYPKYRETYELNY